MGNKKVLESLRPEKHVCRCRGSGGAWVLAGDSGHPGAGTEWGDAPTFLGGSGETGFERGALRAAERRRSQARGPVGNVPPGRVPENALPPRAEEIFLRRHAGRQRGRGVHEHPEEGATAWAARSRPAWRCDPAAGRTASPRRAGRISLRFTPDPCEGLLWSKTATSKEPN